MSAPRGILALEHLAVLRVTGGAAKGFLSRQLTCDVAALSPANALFGAWLTPKGRALCLMHVVDSGDGEILLVVPDELADDVARRLAMFVLRDDVQIARSTAHAVIGLAGEDAVRAGCEAAPAAHLPAADPPLALALTDAVGARRCLDALAAAGHARLHASDWELARIRAGVPWVVEATRDAFVPQMMNLDLLGAVSFSKGCYPGQEIVARTQHLGRIKRRTFIGHCDGSAPCAVPGDSLFAPDTAEAAGRVLSSVAHDGGQDMLAVLSLEATANGDTFHLHDPRGPAVRFAAPPYLDVAGAP